TKHNYLVTRAADVAPVLHEAFHIARSGRPGPVLVDISKDAQQGSARLEAISAPPRDRPLQHASELAIRRAAALIDAAERPLILAGHGVLKSQSSKLLREFAEKTGIPVASTLLGLGGFPASHPLSLGMMGMHGEAFVNTALQEADLLLAFGMRFDDRVTGKLLAPHVLHDLWRLTEGKALVVTDVGQHQMWEAQYYKHERPRSLITSGGLGTMGFALPAAIGARFARPDDEIWVVVGDGGFQMTSCELTTCAQEGIKVNVAIINNGYLGMVRRSEEHTS